MNIDFQILFIDVIVGLLASFVPIYAMNPYFTDQNCMKNGISYLNIVRIMPIFFAIITPILMMIFRYLGLNKNTWSWLVIGFIYAMVISSIGRFMVGIPTKVMEMENPNMFHIFAIITWVLFFSLLAKNVYGICLK